MRIQGKNSIDLFVIMFKEALKNIMNEHKESTYENDDYRILSDNPTIEEIAGFSIELLNKKFIPAKFDLGDLEVFKGSRAIMPEEQAHFLTVIYYLIEGVSSCFDGSDMPKMLKEEIIYHDEKGDLCLFISFVARALFEALHVFGHRKIRIIQGFYKHELRKDFPNIIPMGKIQSGIHSFLEVEGCIIDLSLVYQIKDFFEFAPGDLFIYGRVPKGLELYGWEIPEIGIDKYFIDVAHSHNLSMGEYMHKHYKTAQFYTLDAVKGHI